MNYSRRPVRRAAVGVLAGTLALTGGAIVAGVSPANALQGFTAERLAGADRFETAADIAVKTFGTSDTVVLARSDDFPDALTGNYLAGIKGAPLLVTETANLTPATSVALETLEAKNVIIVGGAAAVSDAVKADLEAQSYNVRRLGGLDRYKTAELIANDAFGAGVGTVGTYNGLTTAVLGTGEDFPDVLAAGPLGFAKKFPITITFPTDLPQETIDVYAALDIKQVIVVGGTDAVSQSVREEVATLTGHPVVPLEDLTRAGTAVAIANFAYDELDFNPAHVNLARSDDFVDALAGGPHGGFESAPIVITASGTLSDETKDFLTARAPTLKTGNIFGGTAAVSTAVENAAVAAAQTVTTNQTFTVTPAEAASLGFQDENGTTPTADDRTYTVTGLDNTKTYDIALFLAANVTNTNGTISFKDTDATPNVADGSGDTTVASITNVNNAAVSPAGSANNVIPVNGAITFTLDATAVGSVIPVVFLDTGATANQLDLASTDQPSEAFGIGGALTVTAPAATSSADGTDGRVVALDKTANTINIFDTSTATAGNYAASDADVVYTYDDNDSFAVEGVPATVAEFEAQLSRGDGLTVGAYSTTPSLVSVFDINDDSPNAPTVTAVVGTGANTNDITVTIAGNNIPNEALYDTFTVQRTLSSAPTAWATIATVAGSADADTVAAQFQYDDNDVAVGSYLYRALGTIDGDSSANSTATGAVVSTAPPADTAAPLAIDTISTSNAGLAGDLGAGDVFKVVYGENIAAPSGTTTFRLTDGDGTPTQADLVNGSNATFTVNAAAETVNGISRAANRVLTVTLTGAPTTVVAGSSLGVQLPATITAAGGITDTAGNIWTPAGGSQDVIINALGLDTQNNSLDTTVAIVTATDPSTGDTTVVFTANEALTAGSATVADFSGTGTVTSVVQSSDGLTITATVTALLINQTVILNANSVTDLAGNDSPASGVTATA